MDIERSSERGGAEWEREKCGLKLEKAKPVKYAFIGSRRLDVEIIRAMHENRHK